MKAFIRLAEDEEGRNVVANLNVEGEWPPPLLIGYADEPWVQISCSIIEPGDHPNVVPGALYVRASNLTPERVAELGVRVAVDEDEKAQSVLDAVRNKISALKDLPPQTDHRGPNILYLTTDDAQELLDLLDRNAHRVVHMTQRMQETVDEALRGVQRTTLEDLKNQVPHDLHTHAAIIEWLAKQAEAV